MFLKSLQGTAFAMHFLSSLQDSLRRPNENYLHTATERNQYKTGDHWCKKAYHENGYINQKLEDVEGYKSLPGCV